MTNQPRLRAVDIRWTLAYLLGAFIVGGASIAVQGPLPGDVVATTTLQAIFGPRPAWADALSNTAKLPLAALTLLLACGMAAFKGGLRTAASPMLAYVLAHLLNAGLRAIVHVPRPDVSLVAVAKAASDSGLPSTFALVYACVFGAVIVTPGRARTLAKAVTGVAAGLIVVGCAARIVLGGHWTSQVVASLLLSFAAVFGLRALISTWVPRASHGADGG